MNIWFIEVIRPVVRKDYIDQILDDPDLINEEKYDGYRALLDVKNGKCILVSRNHNRLPFRDLERRLEKCLGDREVILDGEVCSLDKRGRPHLADLASHKGFIVYIAFDILSLDGKDLTEKPLLERKKILDAFGKDKPKCFQVSQWILGHGKKVFKEAHKRKREGIIAKHKDGIYRQGIRWYKIKDPNYKRSKPVSHIFINKY